MSEPQLDAAIDALNQGQVGGSYWGQRPDLGELPYTLVAVRDDQQREAILAASRSSRGIVCCGTSPTSERPVLPTGVDWLGGCVDPWHLVSGADEVFADADDELVLIAALAEKRTHVVGEQGVEPIGEGRHALRALLSRHPAMAFDYVSPFTGEEIALAEAVAICAFWRGLIDGNRSLAAAAGFANWKRRTVAPLLWAGGAKIPFLSSARRVEKGAEVAIWKSRTSAPMLANLERCGARLIEVEDGFIRSVGLGADCVPPLSIVVDRLGPYFDPASASELEQLIARGSFPPSLLDRAQSLRALVVKHGISKYAAGQVVLERRSANKRHLLVTGQVEDDRSVISGGGGVRTNLELLRRVRASAPDAYIIYKPHPDVEAGHRVGRIAEEVALTLADEVLHDVPIGALIDLVDEVHVNTSLAGFEALLRGRVVVTHGVPFYAGWGLTTDLGNVPSRRVARPTLNELVAATLLLYPRYLDPQTGLPCPPEILIERMTAATASDTRGVLVDLRRLQGRIKRVLASVGLRGAA